MEAEGSLGDRSGEAGDRLIVAEGSGNCAAAIWNGSHRRMVVGGDFYHPGNGLKRRGLANTP